MLLSTWSSSGSVIVLGGGGTLCDDCLLYQYNLIYGGGESQTSVLAGQDTDWRPPLLCRVTANYTTGPLLTSLQYIAKSMPVKCYIVLLSRDINVTYVSLDKLDIPSPVLPYPIL